MRFTAEYGRFTRSTAASARPSSMGTIASPNLRIPTLSPRAFEIALPNEMATSSTMWWVRSPLALTVTSMRLCVANESSMWSRKPIPVLESGLPVPSISTMTVMSVSFVFLLISPCLVIVRSPRLSAQAITLTGPG